MKHSFRVLELTNRILWLLMSCVFLEANWFREKAIQLTVLLWQSLCQETFATDHSLDTHGILVWWPAERYGEETRAQVIGSKILSSGHKLSGLFALDANVPVIKKVKSANGPEPGEWRMKPSPTNSPRRHPLNYWPKLSHMLVCQ